LHSPLHHCTPLLHITTACYGRIHCIACCTSPLCVTDETHCIEHRCIIPPLCVTDETHCIAPRCIILSASPKADHCPTSADPIALHAASHHCTAWLCLLVACHLCGTKAVNSAPTLHKSIVSTSLTSALRHCNHCIESWHAKLHRISAPHHCILHCVSLYHCMSSLHVITACHPSCCIPAFNHCSTSLQCIPTSHHCSSSLHNNVVLPLRAASNHTAFLHFNP
jgi:hypothetical protein